MPSKRVIMMGSPGSNDTMSCEIKFTRPFLSVWAYAQCTHTHTLIYACNTRTHARDTHTWNACCSCHNHVSLSLSPIVVVNTKAHWLSLSRSEPRVLLAETLLNLRVYKTGRISNHRSRSRLIHVMRLFHENIEFHHNFKWLTTPIILYPAKHNNLTAVMMNLIHAKSTYLLGTLSIIVLAPPIYMKRDSIVQTSSLAILLSCVIDYIISTMN